MVDVDALGVGSFGALLIGLVLLAGGVYARRHGMIRDRTPLAFIAVLVAIAGALILGFGVIALLR
jgi:hypothetical protein